MCRGKVKSTIVNEVICAALNSSRSSVSFIVPPQTQHQRPTNQSDEVKLPTEAGLCFLSFLDQLT